MFRVTELSICWSWQINLFAIKLKTYNHQNSFCFLYLISLPGGGSKIPGVKNMHHTIFTKINAIKHKNNILFFIITSKNKNLEIIQKV